MIRFEHKNDVLTFAADAANPLNIDHKNSQFTAITVLINTKNPKYIRIKSPIKPKPYLCLLAGIQHAQFNGKLTLELGPSAAFEDYLFPISKRFAQTAICTARSATQNCQHFTFTLKSPSHFKTNSIGFYIITNGQNSDWLNKTLNSILAQNSTIPIHLYLIGPKKLLLNLTTQHANLDVLDDSGIYTNDTRFPISKKKNIALNHGKHPYVVILHDRISLEPHFADHLTKTVSHFDLYTCHVTAQKNGKTYRYGDKVGYTFKSYLTMGKALYYMSHKEDNQHQMIDGGLMVFNMHTASHIRFDERLHWGEMEDIDLMASCKQDCLLITYDNTQLASSVFCNHFALKNGSILTPYKMWLRRSAGLIQLLKKLKRTCHKIKH